MGGSERHSRYIALSSIMCFMLIITIIVCSGCFLFCTFSLPSFAQRVRERETFAKEIKEHTCTNFVLINFCVCLVVNQKKSLIYYFSIGEIFYRFVVLFAQFLLKSNAGNCMQRISNELAGDHSDQPADNDTDQPALIVPVATSEINYHSSRMVGEYPLPLHKSEHNNNNTSNQSTVSYSNSSSSQSESPSPFISAQPVSSECIYNEDSVHVSPPMDRVYDQCTDNTNSLERCEICFTPY